MIIITILGLAFIAFLLLMIRLTWREINQTRAKNCILKDEIYNLELWLLNPTPFAQDWSRYFASKRNQSQSEVLRDIAIVPSIISDGVDEYSFVEYLEKHVMDKPKSPYQRKSRTTKG